MRMEHILSIITALGGKMSFELKLTLSLVLAGLVFWYMMYSQKKEM